MGQAGEESIVLEVDGSECVVRFERSLTIGRDPVNDLVLEGDGVSRHHAMIRAQAGAYFLVDLASSNGTFVNGRPMGGAAALTPGDEIGVGDKRVRFVGGDRTRGHQNLTEGAADNGLTTERLFLPHEVCVLVSDIREFSRLSEAVPGERMPQIIADWFHLVGDLVQEHGGTIEKFRGDSVMAFWTPSAGADLAATVARALGAATGIVSRAASYGEEVAGDLGRTGFRVGCGVHRGLAFLGNIGSDSRRDITMLGDCVNLTFRIESLCARLDRPVLVSAQVRAAVGDDFRFEELGSHRIKGKDEPIEVFALEV